MRKFVKAALAVGACLALTGCPKATSVTGAVHEYSVGGGETQIVVNDSLKPALTYRVAAGASITVTYDNNATCTFRGPMTFIPGDDGSVCKKKDDKDEKQDNDDQQQDQQQGDASNGNSGIRAPEVTATPVPGYSGINAPSVTPSQAPQFSSPGSSGSGSGIGGPQVIATAMPTYTRIMSIVTNPIVTNTMAVIGAISLAKEIRDQTDGNNGDKPLSK